jgi:hypothetical protein
VLLILVLSTLACDLTPLERAIEDALRALWDAFLKAITDEILRILEEIRRQVEQAVENLVNGIVEQAQQAIDAVVAWVEEMVRVIERLINDLIKLISGRQQPLLYYTTYTASVRECERLNCAVIARLPPDTPVVVIGSVDGDMSADSTLWRQILYQEREVYIHSSLLTDTPPPPPEPPERVAEPPGLIFPWLPGYRHTVTAGFGDIVFGNIHEGIDFFEDPHVESGEDRNLEVVAAHRGTVVAVVDTNSETVCNLDLNRTYGNYVEIRYENSDYHTIYAHLAPNSVGHRNREGGIESFVPGESVVEQGEVIGVIGCTGNTSGPHLHFELQEGSQPRPPSFFECRGCSRQCQPVRNGTYPPCSTE